MNTMQTRYFRLDRRDLVYLKFILEAYEGLATISTVQQEETVVEISCPTSFTVDVADLIRALQGEIALTEIFPYSARARMTGGNLSA